MSLFLRTAYKSTVRHAALGPAPDWQFSCLKVGSVRAGENCFTGVSLGLPLKEPSPVDGFKACISQVRGHANLVGQMRFFIDPSETTFPGFLFL